MTRHLHIVRPLLALAKAEKRIKEIEPRNFTADPWMRGEGPKFFTVERVAAMKSANETLRAERAARKAK